jgi:hypothetical protein
VYRLEQKGVHQPLCTKDRDLGLERVLQTLAASTLLLKGRVPSRTRRCRWCAHGWPHVPDTGSRGPRLCL